MQQIVKRRYTANVDTVIPVGNRTFTYKKGQVFEANAEDYDVYIDLGILRIASEESKEEAPAKAETSASKKAEKVEEPEADIEEDADSGDGLPETMSELKAMKKPELVDLAKQLALDESGKAKDLVARIAAEIFE